MKKEPGDPLYSNSDDLEKAIEDYFELIKTIRENPTITGLAYHLGFASRQSFYDYEKNDIFAYTIKRARLKIESQYERRLFEQSPTGAIFALKNFGWVDRQEVKHEGIPDPSITVTIAKPTDE